MVGHCYLASLPCIPYATIDEVRMLAFEMLIWCNMFCRMLHIDFIHLFTGVDTLALRTYIDGDLDTDNTAPFVEFLEDHCGPFRSQRQWVNDSVIYPNAWLADKWKKLMSEIGVGFQQVQWCSRPEHSTPKFPHRNLYIHATAHNWCLGPITRYHQARDLVGGCLWFPPSFQIVLRGETIILQVKSVMDRVTQGVHIDPDLLDRYPGHLCGTCVVFGSMMDTTALVHGEWIVRPLRDSEHEVLEKMAQALSLVTSPFVILPPNSTQLGFRGTAALQWDTNIDALVRRLDDHGILFAQPHLWNDIEYDKNKYVLATARNTITLMRMLRICLRLSDAYTQLRCYK